MPNTAVATPTEREARAHLEAHDSHHAAEPDLLDKGLAHNSVGMVGSP